MPDQKQDKPENLLSSLMKQIAGTGEGKKSSSFPVMMVLVGIVVLVVSIMGIKLALAKRKAAKLAAQIRKSEEEKIQAQENLKLASNTTARQTAREEIAALTKETLGLKARMARRQAAHEESIKELEGITSWDDIEIVDARDD